jgi:acetyl esterase/lipase
MKRMALQFGLAFALTALTPIYALAADAPRRSGAAPFHEEFSQPEEAFRLVGNIYYVGAKNIASFLIVTPQGDILIDTGTREMAPVIKANVEKLGFKLTDIKIMLSSHAHFDHIQGHAAMKQATGAKVFAMKLDAEALEAGKDLSPLGAEGWDPVKVDRVLKDGDTVELGGTTLKAMWAPGHTPGCTVWSTNVKEAQKNYSVVFMGCGGPNAGVKLIGNEKFPSLVNDAMRTLDKLATLNPDIFVGGHPEARFKGKIDAMKAGVRPHPLAQPGEWSKMVADTRAQFVKRVDAEKASAAKANDKVAYDPKAKFDLKVSEVGLRKNAAGRMLKARIYQPVGTGPFPTLLDLHGGAWNTKDRLAEEPMDRAIAASGVLVVAIDLTLAGEAPYPACIQDASYGVRWLKSNAALWNGDASKLGIYGSSSGGHVAVLLGMKPNDARYNAIALPDGSKVDATVAYVATRSPITNTVARFENAKRMKNAAMVGYNEKFFSPWSTIEECNPEQILERHEKVSLPPLLVMQGALDDNVLPVDQEKFVKAYKAAGGQVEYELFPDSEHQWVAKEGPQTNRARETVKAFIARQLSG